MAKKKRPATLNRGGADVRAMVLRKIGRMMNDPMHLRDYGWQGALADLSAWLRAQSKRTQAREGGLSERKSN